MNESIVRANAVRRPLALSGLLLWGGLFCALPAHADVTLHGLFTDHMVLQRERPVPVWGKADAGEKVSVVFSGQTKTTTAGADGKWMVELAPLTVSTTPQTLTVKGNNEIDIKDVLVGDVWLGTGQSNMDWTVSGTDGKERIAQTPEAQFNGIRLYSVPQVIADQPADTVGGQWVEPTTPRVMGFSATLFFFGEELHKRQPGVPLGLIRSSVGATNAYSWIPNEVRDNDPSTAYLRQWWGNVMRGWNAEKQAAADKAMDDYNVQLAGYQARKEKVPDTLKRPGEVVGPQWSRRPSALYNGMIAPLQPFSVRGVIWYQGEWDSKRDWVKVYHDTLIAQATSWRANWSKAAGNPKLGEFPFYVVQLPSRIPGDGDFWPYMREVQQKIAQDLPDSGFVTTLDLNDGVQLHPTEKTEIGRRLARLALAREYGQPVAYHGPVFKSARVDGTQMIVTFDSGAGALKSADGQALRNFEVAGEDGKYYEANAEIKGSDVVLTAAQVEKPVTVRYAWMPAPTKPNFVNEELLPAPPFRTDTQPIP